MLKPKNLAVTLSASILLASATALAAPPKFAKLKLRAVKTIKIGTLKLKLRPQVIKPARVLYHKGVFKHRVIVKFKEGAKVRTAKKNQVKLITRVSKLRTKLMGMSKLTPVKIKTDLGKFNAILKRKNIKSFGPLFSRRTSSLDAERKAANKKFKVQHADLGNYYSIILKKGQNGAAVATELNKLPSVELAYLAPIGKDADIPPTTPNYQGSQGYLDPAPKGIDAKYAWTVPGGNGAGIRVIDMERGWTLNHEDLRRHFYKNGVIVSSSKNHGTAVLGVMVAKKDGHGVTGIAYRGSHGVVSAQRQRRFLFIKWTEYNAAEAINVAASKLREGDVILIEQHAKGPNSGQSCACNCGQHEYIAMEYWQAEFDAIRAATARGIIVVQAAGNGGMNLDASRYGNRFKLSYRDSGAIMVAASTSTTRRPTCWTNYGSRIDAHGWGENVMTLGYGGIKVNGNDQRQWYTRTFGGTSSASPIVVGAVMIIQSIRKRRGMGPLWPRSMRRLLRQYGTPQASGTTAKRIARLPDLKKLIARIPGKPVEDCVSFNPNRIKVAKRKGQWKIIEGKHWIMGFKNKKNAQKAYRVVKHYRANRYCFVRRPHPGMNYLMRGKTPPRGKFRGEDCIRMNRAQLRVKYNRRFRKWQIIQGSMAHFAFKDRNAAKHALSIIKKYRFNYTCYVKRPKPGLKYLRQ